ncbi:hypothetical protein C5S35_17180 [Candidatus Methanophagaceae archaeon]|nr:hypothetical protein C5S35_17180 [Methanophagales archaeon]
MAMNFIVMFSPLTEVFWHSKENYNNLPHLLRKVHENSDTSILGESEFSKILEIAGEVDGIDHNIIFSTLKKLELSQGGPGINDVQPRLIGKGLVHVKIDGRTTKIGITEKGLRIYTELIDIEDFQDFFKRAKLLKLNFNLSGTNLMKFIYKTFPEITTLRLGERIEYEY